MSHLSRYFLVFFFALTYTCGVATRQFSPESAALPAYDKITPDLLEGYWESRDDGLIVHITGFEFTNKGNGSFRDINNRLVAAGKFRNIKHIGGNRWECMQYHHSPSLVYPDDPIEITWNPAIIEMLNVNLIQVEKTLYDRK